MREIMIKIIAFLMSITLSTTSFDFTKNNNENEDETKRTTQSITIEEKIQDEELKIKRTGIVQKENAVTSTTGWWSYPEEIKLTKRNGDDLLVLVNKEYRLSESYVPSGLVSASLSGIRRGGSYQLRNIVIDDLRELVNQATQDGVDLSIRSGYRSYQDQLSTYNYWLKYNGNNADYADRVSARAGHSQHQLGTAVDFSTSEIQDGIGGQFAPTKAAKWLEENAYKYGFVISFPKGYESVTGYNYESWHYRYIGKANAQEMVNSGKVLEIYLREKN